MQPRPKGSGGVCRKGLCSQTSFFWRRPRVWPTSLFSRTIIGIRLTHSGARSSLALAAREWRHANMEDAHARDIPDVSPRSARDRSRCLHTLLKSHAAGSTSHLHQLTPACSNLSHLSLSPSPRRPARSTGPGPLPGGPQPWPERGGGYQGARVMQPLSAHPRAIS